LSGKRLVRETSCPGNVFPGNVLSGKVIVRERSCPGKVLSGKRLVRETSVRENDCPGNVCKALKLAVVPQPRQQISAVSGPKITILWRYAEQILLFNKFFRLSIRALVAKIWPDKVVRWCPDGDFLAIFLSCISSEPRAAGFRPAS